MTSPLFSPLASSYNPELRPPTAPASLPKMHAFVSYRVYVCTVMVMWLVYVTGIASNSYNEYYCEALTIRFSDAPMLNHYSLRINIII